MVFFSSIQLDQRRWRTRWRASLCISFVLHLLLLIVLVIHRPAPVRVRLSSVRRGEHGSSLLPVYLPRRGSDDAREWKKQFTAVHLDALDFSRVLSRPLSHPYQGSQQRKLRTAQPSRSASAGSAYGSLWQGSAIGSEVRPALPIFGPQPAIAPSELSPGLEGNVIVEVTIDEHGMVVNEILLHGLAQGIDQRVLEVLKSWRFKPATKDGVAIASKQDVYFHFRAA